VEDADEGEYNQVYPLKDEYSCMAPKATNKAPKSLQARRERGGVGMVAINASEIVIPISICVTPTAYLRNYEHLISANLKFITKEVAAAG
jgi:hypothetical protein